MRKEHQIPICVRCGYLAASIETQTCPECGHFADVELPEEKVLY